MGWAAGAADPETGALDGAADKSAMAATRAAISVVMVEATSLAWCDDSGHADRSTATRKGRERGRTPGMARSMVRWARASGVLAHAADDTHVRFRAGPMAR
jgi:hypothetical protein